MCMLLIMSLNISNSFIYNLYNVAYALINSTKTKAKTKTKLKQKNKTAIITTINILNLLLSLQLIDYIIILLQYK